MADRKAPELRTGDDLDDSLWDSPVKPTRTFAKESTDGPAKLSTGSQPSYADEESREAALKQELASVRKVNEAIEGVLQNLERAKTHMTVRTNLGKRCLYTDAYRL